MEGSVRKCGCYFLPDRILFTSKRQSYNGFMPVLAKISHDYMLGLSSAYSQKNENQIYYIIFVIRSLQTRENWRIAFIIVREVRGLVNNILPLSFSLF